MIKAEEFKEWEKAPVVSDKRADEILIDHLKGIYKNDTSVYGEGVRVNVPIYPNGEELSLKS